MTDCGDSPFPLNSVRQRSQSVQLQLTCCRLQRTNFLSRDGDASCVHLSLDFPARTQLPFSTKLSSIRKILLQPLCLSGDRRRVAASQRSEFQLWNFACRWSCWGHAHRVLRSLAVFVLSAVVLRFYLEALATCVRAVVGTFLCLCTTEFWDQQSTGSQNRGCDPPPTLTLSSWVLSPFNGWLLYSLATLVGLLGHQRSCLIHLSTFTKASLLYYRVYKYVTIYTTGFFHLPAVKSFHQLSKKAARVVRFRSAKQPNNPKKEFFTPKRNRKIFD